MQRRTHVPSFVKTEARLKLLLLTFLLVFPSPSKSWTPLCVNKSSPFASTMLGMSKLELLSRFPLPRPCPFPLFPIFIFWLKPWIVEMAAFAKQAVFLSSLWATGRTWWPWPPFTNALLVVSMNGRLLVFSINEGKAFYYHKISQNSEQTCFVFYFCRKQAWVKIKKRHCW